LKAWLWWVLISGLILSFSASLLVGPAGVGLVELLEILIGNQSGMAQLILIEIRLPRALLGLTIGATLGLAGAALQGYLRNPLAEPGLIGVSATAALGAVIAIYTGLSAGFALALPLGGMVGAGTGVVIVAVLAGANNRVLTLILAGVAVSSLAAALTSLVLNLAPNPFAALEIVFWLMGSLADRSFEHVWLSLPFMLIGWMLLLTLGKPLDALSLGETTAQTLGFNLSQLRHRIILGVALSVGAATSVAGMIGFIGLIVPHLLRPLVGHKPSALLLSSACGGAILTLLADVSVRLLASGLELKLGVLTALIGTPFFLVLIIKTRRE